MYLSLLLSPGQTLPNQAVFLLGFGGGGFSRFSTPCKHWEGAEGLPVSPGQVRECHLHGYSPASSFHLLFLFDIAGFHSSSPLLALLWIWFLYWLIYTPAEREAMFEAR